jgi:DNA-binding NarL/FixJ family response regulator
MQQAVELWGSVTTLRASVGLVSQPYHAYLHKQQVELVRSQLSKQTFLAAWTRGTRLQPMTFAQLHATYQLPAHHTPPAEKPTPQSRKHLLGLTPRELDVLRCIADGLTNAQIAARLIVALPTVNSYQHALYKKLEVSSRSAALRKALDLHLLA